MPRRLYFVISLISVFISILVAGVASAQEAQTYYLELGSDVDDAAAEKQWNELLKNHKRYLGDLTFYPRTIVESGRATGVRIQAGPIEKKAAADRICRNLFKKDVPCFVIEGFEEPPVGTIRSLKETIAATHESRLPWLSKKKKRTFSADDAEVVETKKEDEQVDLWKVLFGGNKEASDTEETAEEKDTEEARSGNVEVAEAIAVPLTSDTVKAPETVQIRALPEQDIPTSQTPDKHDVASWLNVHAFPDEDSASAFWKKVRAAIPRDAAGLRVRVVQPFMLRGKQTAISLNIGPFGSADDADEFCRKGIERIDPYMRCSVGKTNTPEKDAQSDIPKPKTFYWAEVISAENQIEALAIWERLKSEHGAILEGRRSSVAASTREPGRYAVRIGPLTTNEEASGLCSALHEHEIACDIMRTGGQ